MVEALRKPVRRVSAVAMAASGFTALFAMRNYGAYSTENNVPELYDALKPHYVEIYGQEPSRNELQEFAQSVATQQGSDSLIVEDPYGRPLELDGYAAPAVPEGTYDVIERLDTLEFVINSSITAAIAAAVIFAITFAGGRKKA